MELSFYWGGTTVGHATQAPYTDDQFSDLWQLLFTYDRTAQGVIYTELAAWNGLLAVTNPDNSTARVATGVAMVDGKVYTNSANNDLAVGAQINATDYYRVVLRKSWAAQTVTAVLLGPNAVATPALTQTDGTTWEISLATFEKTGGVISGLTDTREWVNAETKYEFIPCVGGYNTDDSIALVPNSGVDGGYTLPDNKQCRSFGQWIIPENIISIIEIDAVVKPLASGDVYSYNGANYGACGEVFNTHTDYNPGPGAGTYAAIAVTLNERECIQPLTLSGFAVADIVALEYNRDATDVQDDINNSVIIYGWRVEYFGRKTGGT